MINNLWKTYGNIILHESSHEPHRGAPSNIAEMGLNPMAMNMMMVRRPRISRVRWWNTVTMDECLWGLCEEVMEKRNCRMILV